MKVAPHPQLHASFRQTVQKLEPKQYENCKKIEKTEFRDLVNLKLLLNRNELKKDLYMKKMHLDDIYPMAYYLLHSYKQFRKKNAKKRSLPLVIRRTIFKTTLKLCGISKSVQHVEVAPNPQLFNGILHASFR